jgi:hypothetical protein
VVEFGIVAGCPCPIDRTERESYHNYKVFMITTDKRNSRRAFVKKLEE